jgi:glutathione S-transferase
MGMRLFTNAGSGNGYKIELLLAQLALPYERIEVAIFQGASRTPEFLAMNPAGSIPVLALDDGTFLPESNAILWHLARGTPFLPDAAFAQSRVLAWLCFEQNQIEPVIGSARYWRMTGRDRDRLDETERRIAQGRRALAVLDGHLATRDFLVDDRYTIADVAMFAYAHLAPDVGVDLADTPAVARWCARIAATPRFIAGPAAYSPDALA